MKRYKLLDGEIFDTKTNEKLNQHLVVSLLNQSVKNKSKISSALEYLYNECDEDRAYNAVCALEG